MNDNVQRNQMLRIFNMAEKPVSDFITTFLGKSRDEVFIKPDEVPTYVEPLVMNPIDEYKKNTYFKFTLNVVSADEDRTAAVKTVNDIHEFDRTREGIGFLYYCVKTVWTSMLASDTLIDKTLVNISFEIDEKNWTFYPIFRDEIAIKKTYYEETLHKMTSACKSVDPDKILEFNRDVMKCVESIKGLNEKYTDEIRQNEIDMNASFATLPRIGIRIKEIAKKDIVRMKKRLDTMGGGLRAV